MEIGEEVRVHEVELPPHEAPEPYEPAVEPEHEVIPEEAPELVPAGEPSEGE